jgi:hypothetical protein
MEKGKEWKEIELLMNLTWNKKIVNLNGENIVASNLDLMHLFI